MSSDLICYKEMPEWTAATLPEGFQTKHNTQAGTWAKLTIFSGELRFYLLDDDGNVLSEHVYDEEHQPPMLEPQVWHKVKPESADLRCQLSFYCDKTAFYTKKYALTATHSEVVAASKIIAPCKTLDLGCGRGRNSLYLDSLGFNVTACDQNQLSIDFLRNVIKEEKLNINTFVYDINNADIQENYDFILSTVVMMFLNRDRLPAIINNMQDHTNVGGYNLIVVALDTEDYPCTIGFSSPFQSQELANYYKDWELIKYNEDIGELHRTDANGNRIKLRFATMLAKKIK